MGLSLGALAIGGGTAAVMAIVTNTFNSDPQTMVAHGLYPGPPSSPPFQFSNGVNHLTLRSVSSLNNPKNSEIKFCENMMVNP
jgi:hypothetical protein